MKTLIKEVESVIRNREENLNYTKREFDALKARIEQEESTINELKHELSCLKMQGQ